MQGQIDQNDGRHDESEERYLGQIREDARLSLNDDGLVQKEILGLIPKERGTKGKSRRTGVRCRDTVETELLHPPVQPKVNHQDEGTACLEDLEAGGVAPSAIDQHKRGEIKVLVFVPETLDEVILIKEVCFLNSR